MTLYVDGEPVGSAILKAPGLADVSLLCVQLVSVFCTKLLLCTASSH